MGNSEERCSLVNTDVYVNRNGVGTHSKQERDILKIADSKFHLTNFLISFSRENLSPGRVSY